MLKLHRLFTSQQLKPVCELGPRALISSNGSFSGEKPPATVLPFRQAQNRLTFNAEKLFHTDCTTSYGKFSHLTNRLTRKDDVDEFDEKKSLLYYNEFERWEKKDKKAFSEMVSLYRYNVRNRAGHVDFIKAALKHMKMYGVHRDLDSYKMLVDILPKGVYICKNKFMADAMYFPRQQFIIRELLDQMMFNGVVPDVELGNMVTNIFGQKSHVFRKFAKMFYWSVKLKNKSPFPLPRPLPTDPFQLAKLAIERITSVDLQSEISVFQTSQVEESVDKTWIVSGQSPKQKKLLKKHPPKVPVIVEGGETIHLLEHSVSYFILKADGEPLPYPNTYPSDPDDVSNIKSKFFNPNYLIKEEQRTVHEQDDGIVYAVCATGTSSRDSLLSWVRLLEKIGNPTLADVPVLFRFPQQEKLPQVTSEELVIEQLRTTNPTT